MSDIARSRYLRERVLETLWLADGAGANFGLPLGKVMDQFACARVEVSEADVRRELNDLVDDSLIRREWDEDLTCDLYRITSSGRDFKKAGYPWDKVDQYTGKRPG